MSIGSKNRRDARKRLEESRASVRTERQRAEGLTTAIQRTLELSTTGPEVLGGLRRAVDTLRARAVELNPTSRIPEYIGTIERALATDAPVTGLDAVIPFLVAIREGWVLGEIVETLSRAPEVDGWLARFEEVSKGGFLPRDQSDHPRNVQAELYVASLLRRSGFVPRLLEPDLVTRFAGREIAIAVKRPQSEAGARAKLKDAVRQIRRAAMPGIVIVDLTIVVGEVAGFWRMPPGISSTVVNEDIKSRVKAVLGDADRLVGEVTGHEWVGGVATVVHSALLDEETSLPIALRPWTWAAIPGRDRASPARRFITDFMRRMR